MAISSSDRCGEVQLMKCQGDFCKGMNDFDCFVHEGHSTLIHLDPSLHPQMGTAADKGKTVRVSLVPHGGAVG